ncbi:MAG: YdcF family protein [Bacteroidales bacterium]|nr:YdcF family protein [Bacteroidales bacterium]
MFFIISKILGFLVYPANWVGILLVGAWLFKKHAAGKKLLWASLAIFVVFSNKPLYNLADRSWSAKPVRYSDLDTNYDYVIALGGMASYLEEYEFTKFNPSADRLLQAMYLYKAKVAKRLFITGGSSTLLGKEQKESDVLKAYLLAIGFDKNEIMTENQSLNTHENAKYTKAIVGDTSKCLIVTSANHGPRALACFKKQGIDTDLFPVNFKEKIKLNNIHEAVLPSLEVFSAWGMLLKEILGYATYKLMGYL